MIYLYYPRKTVPNWLEKVECEDKGPAPQIHHMGYGLLVNWRNHFHVLHLSGHFLYISDHTPRKYRITGGGNGVHLFMNIRGFLSSFMKKENL